MTRIDFGYPSLSVRSRWISGRLAVRLATVTATLFILAMVLAIFAITLGDYPLRFDEVVRTLIGSGEEFHRTIVIEWRLPVLLAALVFGALLGVGGAIFQSLTRNPLGSPDVIGFDAGSYTAVVALMLVAGNTSYWPIAGAAICGGLLTAFAVYVLAYRRGIQGFRLIIVGIGVTAMLGSVNSYLITRADLRDAVAVGFWGAGSLGRVSWSSMIPSLIVAAVIFIAASLLAGDLRRLEMGDDAAVTLGTGVGRARLLLIVVGVSTTAMVTAAAGPIGFIALVAPQIARRLTGTAGVSLLASAAMGCLLLTAAQLLSLLFAQLMRPVPVGLITISLGGVYLIWLLIRETRKQYGTTS